MKVIYNFPRGPNETLFVRSIPSPNPCTILINFFVCYFKLYNVCFFIFKILATTNSYNAQTHTEIRRLCLQHTNSQAHAKNQAAVFAAYERTNSRTYRCGACVCCINTQSQKLTIFPEKEVRSWVCLLQLTKNCKVKKKSLVS